MILRRYIQLEILQRFLWVAGLLFLIYSSDRFVDYLAEAAEGIAQSTRPPVTPFRLKDHYGSTNRLRRRDHLLAAWEITTKIHDDHKSKKSNDAADTMNAQD